MAWTSFTPNDLTYDGKYAKFTTTNFNGYGYAIADASFTCHFILLGHGCSGYWSDLEGEEFLKCGDAELFRIFPYR